MGLKSSSFFSIAAELHTKIPISFYRFFRFKVGSWFTHFLKEFHHHKKSGNP
jgi:hypothetical protein